MSRPPTIASTLTSANPARSDDSRCPGLATSTDLMTRHPARLAGRRRHPARRAEPAASAERPHRESVAVRGRRCCNLAPLLEIAQHTGALAGEGAAAGLAEAEGTVGLPDALASQRQPHLRSADVAGFLQQRGHGDVAAVVHV